MDQNHTNEYHYDNPIEIYDDNYDIELKITGENSNGVNIEKIIKTIEEQTGLKIELIDKNMWNFYPTISYRNSNANIKHNNNSLSIYNANSIIICIC